MATRSTPATTGTGQRLPKLCEAPGCDRSPRQRFGSWGALCGMHLQRVKYSGSLDKSNTGRKALSYQVCSAEGCTRDATRRAFGLCEKHFYRFRRTGVTADPARVPRAKRGNGYLWLNSKSHPLSGKSGVYEHRAVAYNTHGAECPPCAWCGRQLGWSRAVVDHLNERKDDNSPENLVVSCSPCNRARGALKPFLAGITGDGFRRFVQCCTEYRQQVLENNGRK